MTTTEAREHIRQEIKSASKEIDAISERLRDLKAQRIHLTNAEIVISNIENRRTTLRTVKAND